MPLTPEQKVQKLKELNNETNRLNQEDREIEKGHALAAKRELNKQVRAGKQYESDKVATEKWKEFAEHLKQLRSEWTRGYNTDWIAVFYSILALGEKSRAAQMASLPALTNVLTDISSLVGLSPMLDSFFYEYPPETIFSNYADYVQMTDDNILNVDSLDNRTDRNGKLLTGGASPALKEALKGAVDVWLNQEGYHLGADGTCVDNITANPLNKADFEQLRDDPENGLATTLIKMLANDNWQPTPPRPR